MCDDTLDLSSVAKTEPDWSEEARARTLKDMRERFGPIPQEILEQARHMLLKGPGLTAEEARQAAEEKRREKESLVSDRAAV